MYRSFSLFILYLVLFFIPFETNFAAIYSVSVNSIMSHEGESATNPASTSTPAILSKKKRIRAGYRAYITKLISDSRDLLDKGPFLRTQAENLKALLKERKKLLRDFDDEILDLVTEEEIEPEIFDCEEKQVQIQSIITELESRQPTVSDTPSVALAQSAVASVSQNSSIDIVNLPKLHLSNFNGDPKKWQEWWDSFEIIHKNPSISKVNKFRHLRTLLDGRAAAAVSGIQTTDANYDTAIEVLKERFAQKQMIINSHMEALMNLPNVSSVKDVTTLRKLVDDIDINVRSLKSLGLEIKEYGALLNPLVMGKLPEEIRLALTKEMKGKEWELGLVLEILKAELGAREQCAHVKSPASVPSVKPRMQNFSTTSALVNNSNKITCSFCKGLHLSVKCSIVTDKGQRKAILRRQGRCFVCLKKGHISRDCTSKISCHICKQRHHASICDKGDIFTPTGSRGQPRVFTNPVQWQSNPPHLSPRVTNESQPNSSGSNSCNTTMTMHVDTKTSVLLQTAKAYISAAQCPEKTAVARLILDSGSKHSYISEGLRSALSLPTVGKETLTIKTFGDSEGTVRTCDIVQFCVRSPYNSICLYVSAYVVPIVCAPIKNQAINFAIRNYPHLTGLWFADFPANIDDALNCEVLIGSNFYWHFMSGQCRRGEGGPIALESCLGWILSGPVYDCPASASTEVNLTDTHVLTLASNERGEERLLEQQVANFWNLESIGISKDELSLYETFQDEIEFINGRYQVGLPWKQDHPVLPDNYALCKRRLQSTLAKLKANPPLMNDYRQIMKDQEERGIIERVEPHQEALVGKVTYLPHHPVVRKDKETTKVRIVYDASAKNQHGISLNSCLYTGPCLLKTVAEIIARFRLFPVAVTADIEKAFLMISVHPRDRDALRFLWYEDDDIESPAPKHVVYRFARVVFGVSSSPFLLNITLRKHIERYAEIYPDVSSKLIHGLYADDVNSGGHSVQEALEFYERSRKLMKDGGFNLRKWASNSKEIMNEIQLDEKFEVNSQEISTPEDDESFAKTSLPMNQQTKNNKLKVLGLVWDNEKDTINFDIAKLLQDVPERPRTKRTILGLIAKIFDPSGLISPVTAPLKVFLQKLFKENLGWDEQLTEDLANQWDFLLSNIERLGEINIPRFYFGEVQGKPQEIQLFGFCDSSEQAYAAVVYAKLTINGHSRVSLVMSKTRVAPLSKVTIPRLELLSALILARLIRAVDDALSPIFSTRIVRCWTDSITAMYWIKGQEREWKLFVENRVQEIRKLVQQDLWDHCSGADNPADIPTRNTGIVNFMNKGHWLQGPEWLSMDEEHWPKRNLPKEPSIDCIKEMKPTTAVNMLVQSENHYQISKVIDCNRFSSYTRLLRVTAIVFRFIKNCRERVKNFNALTAQDLERAETCWIKDVQSTITEEKLGDLKKHLGNTKDKKGIIRCYGRLNNSSLPIETKNPVLLPKNHYLTQLIIWDCHCRVLHNGTKETLQELRSRFWVNQGRQLVKRILRNCKLCKRIQGLSYGSPKSGQLPEFRVREEHAFSAVGIDFAGPLYVQTLDATKKVYLALFTCGTTRAVHLELVPDLTAETFMLCFRRFVSRRGIPYTIATDNAKTFKTFSKTLIKLLKSSDMKSYLAERRITWRFNLSKAPWWGGFYERLIALVKTCLKKAIGTAKLSSDELHTIIVEIEGVLNSRPLTYIYPRDLEEPLTPAHLLMGRRLLQLPSDVMMNQDEDFMENESAIRKRALFVSKIIHRYWMRWKREYLVSLREYHRLNSRGKNRSVIKVGEVVTIQDEHIRNRAFWKLGRVEELITDKDDEVRGVRIRLGNGHLIDRPIQKVFPLELTTPTSQEPVIMDKELITERPVRAAKTIAKERLEIIDQLEDDIE